jgi:hypothetical protein
MRGDFFVVPRGPAGVVECASGFRRELLRAPIGHKLRLLKHLASFALTLESEEAFKDAVYQDAANLFSTPKNEAAMIAALDLARILPPHDGELELASDVIGDGKQQSIKSQKTDTGGAVNPFADPLHSEPMSISSRKCITMQDSVSGWILLQR